MVVSETFRHYPQKTVTTHVGQASACGVASARLPQVPASRSGGTEVPRRLKPAPHGLSLYLRAST